MDLLQIALIVLVLAISGIYFWIKMKSNYWVKQNAPYDPSQFSFVGNREHLIFFVQEVYKRAKAKSHSFVGMTQSNIDQALIVDLDLLKSVFIENFENFPDRGMYHNLKDDPLSGNIVRLEGEAWKRLRGKLTPTFTSGKLKRMFPTLVEVGEHFVRVIDKLAVDSDSLEMRELCSCFTTDVISSVAFGIDCNSLENPDTTFRQMGDKSLSSFRPIIEGLGTQYPRLFEWIGVKVFPQDLIDFFSKVVTETVEYREKHQVRRNDFLDILIDLKDKKTENGEPFLTMKEIIAQSFVFFVAGFDTSSATMSFCLYELSRHPDIQEKTRKSVMEAMAKHDNQLTYDCVQEMKYLEQVVLETLRKHPVVPLLKRVTRKAYTVPKTSVTFTPGLIIVIPVYALHHDEEYYPEPWKFNPENFSAEAVKARDPLCFLPFGAGPRVCIGERFARIQTMLGLALLLKNFKFSPSDNSPEEMKYDIHNFRGLGVKGGIPLKLKKIK